MLLEAKEVVIKAQILAGGRGKGTFSSGLKGGVQLTKEYEETVKRSQFLFCFSMSIVPGLVERMLGHQLMTHQTGPNGALVSRVMLAEAKDLRKECYVAVLLDRSLGGPALVVSPRGGVDIEAVAESDPEAIHKFPLKDSIETAINEAAAVLFPQESAGIQAEVKSQLAKLVGLFSAVDATMVEINPFGLTPEGEVLCFDAKLEFDENAAFRQAEIFKTALSTEQASPEEIKARSYLLNYIKMDGNIGCLVNGAGLAMATMDLISLNGGSPANFLDVGGGASSAQIKAALEIIYANEQVSAVLINIFGGIMRCDVIAEGIIEAAKSIDSKLLNSKPLVVRLSGTNATAGLEMLKPSAIKMTVCEDAEDAAKFAVQSISK